MLPQVETNPPSTSASVLNWSWVCTQQPRVCALPALLWQRRHTGLTELPALRNGGSRNPSLVTAAVAKNRVQRGGGAGGGGAGGGSSINVHGASTEEPLSALLQPRQRLQAESSVPS